MRFLQFSLDPPDVDFRKALGHERRHERNEGFFIRVPFAPFADVFGAYNADEDPVLHNAGIQQGSYAQWPKIVSRQAKRSRVVLGIFRTNPGLGFNGMKIFREFQYIKDRTERMGFLAGLIEVHAFEFGAVIGQQPHACASHIKSFGQQFAHFFEVSFQVDTRCGFFKSKFL